MLIYLLFIAVFIVMKPQFMLLYSSEIGASASDWLAVIYHGFSMDLSTAAYFTIIPGLILSLSLIFPKCDRFLNYYMMGIGVILAFLLTLDFGLYGSWGFRLDATPFFYIFSSPRSAMASLEWWHYPLALVAMVALFLLIYLPYRQWIAPIRVDAPTNGWRRWGSAIGMLLITGMLFLPIRGSVTVSTMNPSRAYFSTNQRLNHAALNPLFTLFYSLSHQTDFASQYRFMDDDEAAAALHDLLYIDGSDSQSPPLSQTSDTIGRPNVVLIILESFSAHLLPSLGGEEIALGLDSVAREGVSFTNFYASSFRTDRGLAAILSSFPGPTNTSLLKYVEKFENLPSLPSEIKRQGEYNLHYYYGGDANFTNMQAYLVSMGFDNIVSDRDFPISEKTSKWGAHDDVLFDRAFADLKTNSSGRTGDKPTFTVIQTSSSHEPFEVPYHSARFPSGSAEDRRRNAFAFTDSCVTEYVNALRRDPSWGNTLVILTADHYGAYPIDVDDPPERHRIPLVLTGGWAGLNNLPRQVDKLSMQTDLGATILALLNLDHSRLRESRNILSDTSAPVAIFTEPSLVGIVTPTDTLVYNPDADAVIQATRPIGTAPADSLLHGARAFLRHLSSTLDHLGKQ